MSDAHKAEGHARSTLLGSDTSFEGLLTFRGEARVDGALRGEVRSAGSLILGPTATVEAKVEVAELVLAGQFKGEVTAHKRVVLEAGARFEGNLRTARLRIADGAQLEARCETLSESGPPIP